MSEQEDDRWAAPSTLTDDQKIDWEQARALDKLASALRSVVVRLQALEDLLESMVKPLVAEHVAWASTKRRVLEVLWDSGIGPVRTGPTSVAVFLLVILAVLAQQFGVDPIALSREGRSWVNGECVSLQPPADPPESPP